MTQGQPRAAGARPTRALIVDDHPLFADALALALDGVFPGVALRKAGSLAEALKALDAGFAPELVLFDLRLPDVQGLSGFVTLRARLPGAKILVISGLASRAVVRALMQAGSAGFLPKNTPLAALQAALAEVARGQTHVPAQFRDPEAGPAGPAEAAAGGLAERLAQLTPQQQRVMQLICAGKPNKQIAYELQLAEATVKAHITALLRRLGVRNRTQAALAVEAARAGTLATEEPPETRNFLCH
jgi:DNA-binding NarL/FixJ family response regulator